MVRADVTTVNELSMPIQKRFILNACLRDQNGYYIPPRMSFRISNGRSDSLANSDINGCVHWTEIVHYNSIDSKYVIKFNRTIFSAENFFDGSVPVEFYINPLSSEFFDKSFVHLLDLDVRM